ncbi:MAG: hypothetical protein JW959_03030 [Pirellulales bacterium]|nr:hypothetical protein [Pirellulales bacterium]
MFHAYRGHIAWYLIVTMAVISTFGEGLHYIPGCGHGTPAGEKNFLLGFRLPADQPPPDGKRLADSEGAGIPLYDEDQCAICSVVGHKVTAGDSFQIILVTPLVYDLPATVLLEAPAADALSFQARAPPLV